MTFTTNKQKSIVFGSWLGWSLDDYDLGLLLLVIPLSTLFFPADDPTFSLLVYICCIYHYSNNATIWRIFVNFDKYGRKKAMIITIMGFSAATFATGLLPTW